jgi:hypothetical protein
VLRACLYASAKVPLWSGRCEDLTRVGVEVLMRSIYAGVDWASEKHDVLIADETLKGMPRQMTALAAGDPEADTSHHHPNSGIAPTPTAERRELVG